MQLRLSRANLDDHTDLCSTTTYADLQCNLEPTEFPVGPATLFPIRDQTTARTFFRPHFRRFGMQFRNRSPMDQGVKTGSGNGPGNEKWIGEWIRE